LSGSCREPLTGYGVDDGAVAAPGMDPEQKAIVGQVVHQPVRRFPDTIRVVIDRSGQDRAVREQRLPGAFQGGEFTAFEVQLYKSGRQIQRVERMRHDAHSAGSGKL
jgi:hypothetical protein